MNCVLTWATLIALVTPHAPAARRGQPQLPVETILRNHFIQQWFCLSDSAMEEALFNVPLYGEFAGLDNDSVRLPEKSSILRNRHLLETHMLASPMLAIVSNVLRDKGLMLLIGKVVNATLISAPSSIKSDPVQPIPEMHRTLKGNQWPFVMNAPIGVDALSGQVHADNGTAVNTNDVVEANGLLHSDKTNLFGYPGYQGVHIRPEAKDDVGWHIAMRPAKHNTLDTTARLTAPIDDIERLKSSIRAKYEHPFRVIKRRLGFTKIRYRGLKNSTAQITTSFAQANLLMLRREFIKIATWRCLEISPRARSGNSLTRNSALAETLDREATGIDHDLCFSNGLHFSPIRCSESP